MRICLLCRKRIWRFHTCWGSYLRIMLMLFVLIGFFMMRCCRKLMYFLFCEVADIKAGNRECADIYEGNFMRWANCNPASVGSGSRCIWCAGCQTFERENIPCPLHWIWSNQLSWFRTMMWLVWISKISCLLCWKGIRCMRRFEKASTLKFSTVACLRIVLGLFVWPIFRI